MWRVEVMIIIFAIKATLKFAAVELGVNAFEKEFQTIERRMHSWIRLDSFFRLSKRVFRGRFKRRS